MPTLTPSPRAPADPKADRHGRRWLAQPRQPLWTLQIRDELALPGTEPLPQSRPLTLQVDGRAVAGQLVARRRVDGVWWGLCLLNVEWDTNAWQQQLSWQPAGSLTLTDV